MTPHTRRAFLAGAGATFLGLRLFGAAPALAAAPPVARRPKRFIAVFSANGQPRGPWFPTTDIPFQPVLGAQDARFGRLADLPGPGMSQTLGPEFDRFRDKLTLVRGLDMVQVHAEGHYAPKMLNACGTPRDYRATVDQVLARSPQIYPTPGLQRSLHLLVQGPQPLEDSISISEVDGVSTVIHGQQHADEAFRRLFRSPTYADRGDTRRVASERRVLDQVRAQYDALSKNPRLGAGDRYRLEAHASLIDDLERRLLTPSTPPVSCGIPNDPLHVEPINENMAAITRDHIDVLTAAIRCGLTRVATLQLCSSTDSRNYPDAEGGPYFLGHHLLTHRIMPGYDPQVSAINRTFALSFARLLEQLDVVEEPDTGRTFLDNSLVYWGNEFGTNYDHACSGFPVLLAGGKDVLETGRYLDYRRMGLRYEGRSNDPKAGSTEDGGFEWRGRPYNQLLVSLLLAMGLTPDQWERPGETGFGDYRDNHGGYVLGDRRAPLPGLLAGS